uniref:Ig-like domain-containing protein n=1 Tax=Esox lucius TaxID=8010 RepID=A0AAY5K818_ESOLU
TFIESRIYIILPIHLWFPTNTTIILLPVYGTSCLVLECWFVQERPNPAATFCSSSLHPPEGSVQKPQCEINPFMPHPTHTPIYLQADWYSAALPSHPLTIKRHSSNSTWTIYYEHGVIFSSLYVSFCLPEPPSLSIFSSPLRLSVPGQVVTVQCEASGFSPLSLELHWELMSGHSPRAAYRATGRAQTAPTVRQPICSWTQLNWIWAVGGRSPVWPSTLEEPGRPGSPSVSSVRLSRPGSPLMSSVRLNRPGSPSMSSVRLIIHMPFMMGPDRRVIFIF